MKLEDIWNKIKTILEEDTVLSTYIKIVYSGTRENIPVNMFPCIILEPTNAPEEAVTMPHNTEINFTATIFGYIKIFDVDKQIVGDATNKGILDLNFDIKKALGAHIDLDGECLYFSFPDTRFDFSSYPFRGTEIDIKITLRQSFVTRE
ncbi:hypothetical protein ES708_27630 [subsurface metagenome]